MALNNRDENQLCFYVPGETSIIDLCKAGHDGVVRSYVNGETLELVRQRYPKAEQGMFDDVFQTIDKLNHERFTAAPKEIDEERWNYLLNVLPPMHWRGSSDAGSSESFMLVEFTCGTITTIACRIGRKYYEMQNNATLRHDEIVKLVTDSLQSIATS